MNTVVRACCLLLLAALVPAATCAAQGVPATVQGRFDALDTNADGTLSMDEYDSEATFSALDTDGNNSVSAAEVEAVIGPPVPGMPSAADRIRVADKNGDGALDDEELLRGAQTRFQWLDTNQDGDLDLSEMTAGFGVPMH